jgi:hypothetical protein
MILPAARVDDDVTHSTDNTFGRMGIVGGAVVGLVMVLVGPELGAAAGVIAVVRVVVMGVVGGAATGQSVGKTAESIRQFAIGDCKIKKGADHVFTNMKESAIADPKCKTTHGSFVITGADHVYIEMARASRIMDLTSCPGMIVSGSPNTHIGGEVTAMSNQKDILDMIGIALDIFSKGKSAKGVFDTLGKWRTATMLEKANAANSAYNLATGGNTATKSAGQGFKFLKWLGVK